MNTPQPNTVGDLHAHLVQSLRDAGVDEAAAKADWWLAENLGLSPSQLPDRSSDRIPSTLESLWPTALARLARHEPLAHVLGHVPFHELSLGSDSRALIPRPETEELVSLLLANTAWWEACPRTVVDVGTGSGCIALALAHARPEAHVYGIDQSPDALDLARDNATRCGLERVRFCHGDLLADWDQGPIDLVVANLPYIPSSDCDTLSPEVRDFDPRSALDGGADGLNLIRRLTPQAYGFCRGDSRLALEIGAEQGDSVLSIVRAVYGANVQVKPDFLGKPRFVFAHV